jgi:hypothetical protein
MNTDRNLTTAAWVNRHFEVFLPIGVHPSCGFGALQLVEDVELHRAAAAGDEPLVVCPALRARCNRAGLSSRRARR